MKYKKEIEQSFKRLGKTPIGNQLESINEIIYTFIDKRFSNIVLNAPTGAGKSIIGAVVADVISNLRQSKLASLILMHNNALTKQYYETFKDFSPLKYIQLKGANNYKCEALSTDDGDGLINAENCAVTKFKKEKLDEVITKYCDNCEYQKLKKLKNESANVITNFSYYFVDRQFTEIFKNRDIVIWDEAHTINDAFCEHNAIYFSKDRLSKCYEELGENLKLNDLNLFKKLKTVQEALINKKINEKNYIDYLKILNDVYHIAFNELQRIADSCGHDMNKYTKFSKLAKKYFGLGCKIDDLLVYNYEHIFEFNEKAIEATVKPIFIGNMFVETLVNSDFNLFMSATISKEYIVDTLKIPEDEVAFIKVPATFPKEHKLVVFFNTQNLNFKSMQDENVQKKLCSNVEKIVKKHVEDYQENGIILTPSFAVSEKMAEAIRKSKIDVDIFEHVRGMKGEEVVAKFKAAKKTSVLISPSIYEGIDLPGDLSRYQIIVKAPFPSLAEKRMEYILKHHQNIYSLLCIKKLVQGCGRSVRAEDDFCVTYMLDANSQRLFTSSQNVWRDEFSVSFSSTL